MALRRIVRAAVGVAAVAVGGALLLRPFTSLALLLLLCVAGLLLAAVAHLATLSRPMVPLALAPPAAYALAAVAVVVWPGSGVVALVWLVGVCLVGDGAVSLSTAVRGSGPGRATASLRGAADVVLGALALAWPDVTAVVVAALLGVRVTWTGLQLLWDALAGPPRSATAHRPVPWWRRGLSFVAAALTLALALGLAALGALVEDSVPVPDAFYDAPDDVPNRPGALLRADDFDRALPEGAVARRILYTTTGSAGEAALASAVVVAPVDAKGPLPVVAWAHGTTGVARGCAPSLLDQPFEAGAFFTLADALAQGWAVVATDYVGLGTRGPHAYLVGEPAGHAVLDAVRAARDLPDLRLSGRTVVWGHSQGGHAALWAGGLAPSYAPDTGVVGVAALAPASDLLGLVPNLDTVPGGSIFASYVLAGYAAAYDDVRARDYVRGAAQVQVRETATRCLSGAGALLNVLGDLVLDESVFTTDPASGALGERLRENVPTRPIDAPLLLAQGEDDALVLPRAQESYARGRCEAGGGPVDYRTYPGRDHVGLVAADSPLVEDLLGWTADRFAGRPPPDGCR